MRLGQSGEVIIKTASTVFQANETFERVTLSRNKKENDIVKRSLNKRAHKTGIKNCLDFFNYFNAKEGSF